MITKAFTFLRMPCYVNYSREQLAMSWPVIINLIFCEVFFFKWYWKSNRATSTDLIFPFYVGKWFCYFASLWICSVIFLKGRRRAVVGWGGVAHGDVFVDQDTFLQIVNCNFFKNKIITWRQHPATPSIMPCAISHFGQGYAPRVCDSLHAILEHSTCPD